VGFCEVFNQDIYWSFQNEVKQRGGGLWVCGVNRTYRQAHPWVVLLGTSHLDFFRLIEF
jgi:hypothetical protein